MGITSEMERHIILDACKKLPCKIHNNNNEQIDTVDSWLMEIRLEQYSETFAKHLYHDMGRIKRIWDVELSAVLDIEKIGHRKRILASVSSGEHITTGPKLEDINADLNFLVPYWIISRFVGFIVRVLEKQHPAVEVRTQVTLNDFNW